MAQGASGLGCQGDDGDESAGFFIRRAVALVSRELHNLRIVLKESASEGIEDGAGEFVDVSFLFGGEMRGCFWGETGFVVVGFRAKEAKGDGDGDWLRKEGEFGC